MRLQRNKKMQNVAERRNRELSGRLNVERDTCTKHLQNRTDGCVRITTKITGCFPVAGSSSILG
jgi:hypothetical protein